VVNCDIKRRLYTMSMPLIASWQTTTVSPLALAYSAVLQRKCSCGQHTAAGGECAECRQKREGMLQRAAINSAPTNRVPPIVHDVLNSPGQPLDAQTRGFMEPRFGHDFSQVRVHSDARATESAQAVNALAYTVGRDVVFGKGEYEPGTSEGRRLLAHELTHVVQQGGREHYSAESLVGFPTDVFEREAESITNMVSAGKSAAVSKRTDTPLIQHLLEPSPSLTPPIVSSTATGAPSTPSTGTTNVVRIVIQRDAETAHATLGTLTVGGQHFDVLELPDHSNHPNTSRAPVGTYQAHIRTDGHLHWRIELENVPGRSHIEIHRGNFPGDSLGCILPGTSRGPGNRVNNSVNAMNQIQQEITNAGPGARIEVIIHDPVPPGPPGPGDFPIPTGPEKFA
jgi:hypothetical protein